MADRITISGLDDCMRFFDNAPDKMLKVAREAVRKGGQACCRHVKGRMDARWRSLVRSKVRKNDDGNIYATFGLFNGHQREGHQTKDGVDTWFKAYWKNYGTLEGRDPEHVFKSKVKPATTAAARSRRNRRGEMHQNFFENALVGYQDVFITKFDETIKNRIKEVY